MSLDLASSYYTCWTESKHGSSQVPLAPPNGPSAFRVVDQSIWANRPQPGSTKLSWDDVLSSPYGKLTSYQASKSIWGPPSPQDFSYEPSFSPDHTHAQLASPPWPASPQSSAPSSPGLGSFAQRPSEVPFSDYPIYDELVNAMALAYSQLCVVQFKGQRLEIFVKSQQSLAHLPVGSHVVVDADRGRDLGLLIAENASPEEAALVRYRQYKKQSEALHSSQAVAASESALPISSAGPKPIIRAARQSEIQLLDAKTSAEAKAVILCNQKIRERGLPMTAVDAEYQWDRRKLTFYYKANQRVDFRDLIKDLFRIYKTRIWMCAVSDTTEDTL